MCHTIYVSQRMERKSSRSNSSLTGSSIGMKFFVTKSAVNRCVGQLTYRLVAGGDCAPLAGRRPSGAVCPASLGGRVPGGEARRGRD